MRRVVWELVKAASFLAPRRMGEEKEGVMPRFKVVLDATLGVYVEAEDVEEAKAKVLGELEEIEGNVVHDEAPEITISPTKILEVLDEEGEVLETIL